MRLSFVLMYAGLKKKQKPAYCASCENQEVKETEVKNLVL